MDTATRARVLALAGIEVRLSPSMAQWEQREDGFEDGDLNFDETAEAVLDALDEFERSARGDWAERAHDVSKELRIPSGKGGGRWTKNPITSAIAKALEEWGKGDGPDDPFVLEGKPIDREPLRKAAVARGITLKRGASRDDIVAALKADVGGKVRAAKAANPDAGKPVRFTLTGGSVDPAKVREVEVENSIRAAYRDLQRRPGDWVPIADLRELVAEEHNIRTAEFDMALTRMAVQPGQHVIPWDNTKALTPRDRAASVRIGGQETHAVRLEDPSPRPVPKPDSKLRNLDVGVYNEGGKVSLWEVSDSGERRRRVALVGDLAGLEKWANDNGESQLADWARKEQGGAEAPKAPDVPAKATPAAPRKGRAATAAVPYKFTGVTTANAEMFPDRAERVAVFDAFHGYKGIGSSRINKALREGRVDGRVELMDKAFASSHLTSDVVVHRGSSGAEFGPDSLSGDLTGKEWTDLAFVSTSPEPTHTKRRKVMARITAPAGTPAVALRAPNRINTPESEILLDRGLRYRVTADRGVDAEGVRHIDVEVVPHDTPDVPTKATPAAKKAAPAAPSTVDLAHLRTLDREVARDELDLRKVDELKALLREQKLPVSGRKRELVDRLVEHTHGGDSATPPKAPAESAADILASLPADLTPAQKRARLRSKGIPKDQIDALVPLPPRKRAGSAARARELALLGVTRALGHDVTPGHDELHHYWTRGPGLPKWIKSRTQFRTLRALLAKATKGKVSPEALDRFAAAWVHEVTGFWPGSDMHRVLEGGKPRGHRIGPG